MHQDTIFPSKHTMNLAGMDSFELSDEFESLEIA
jgi:hypothetical protein